MRTLRIRRLQRARTIPFRGAVLGVLCLLAATAVQAQGAWNVDLLGHPPAPGGRGVYAACWGYTAPDGTELAMIGAVYGTEIYDLTDPTHPKQVAIIDGPRSRWREMQTWSHYAYIVTEGAPTVGPGGVQIVDLADPQHPLHVANFDSTFTTAHTIHIADGYAYVNGTDNGWRVLDLSDPIHPRDVGGYSTRYVHDCYVRDNLAYLCNISSYGFTILDISDPAHPSQLSFTQYFGASTHNAWGTKDGKFLLTTDEVSGGHLRIWNVENPRLPFQVGDWIASNTTASIHNVVVKGDSAYISYYTEGLQVLDISTPEAPRLVGFYDTYPGSQGLFEGNWGVYPLTHNGSIYLSDISTGLYVVRMGQGGQPIVDFQVAAPEGQVAVPGQNPLWFFFDIYNGSSGNRTYELQATTTAGWPVSVQPTISVVRGAIQAVMVTIEVPATISSPTRVGVELCARNTTSGYSLCAESRVAVPVVLQGFEAEAAGTGIELRWMLRRDPQDTGTLVIQRGRVGEDAFTERARLPLESGSWRDLAVAPGDTWRYRLAIADARGTQVLGEREVALVGPARSRLLGNVPNPFNPTTRIRFELAQPGPVTVAVFDTRGRLVRNLTAHAAAAGEHVVVWDGRDDARRPLPSGVYLYEVRAPGWSARGRMTLAK